MNSSVLKWPDRNSVIEALLKWCQRVRRKRNDILRIGYFGSYAKDEAGVGSDLDVIVVIEKTDLPPHRRVLEWDMSEIPVPVDLLVYTAEEFENRQRDPK